MVYRNKTYVCFDADTDGHYYRLMLAWNRSDYQSFNFYNAHDLNTARDTSTEESIKRQLRERLRNSSVLVVLIGEQTRYLYRFVRWEMEQALGLGMPIIGVNLNGLRKQDTDRCPPVIRDELAIHISFNASVVQYTLDNWPASHAQHRQRGETGPYYYKDTVYRQLGL